MDEIIEYSEYLKKAFEKESERRVYAEIRSIMKKGRCFIILKGLRGSGKTTILKSLARHFNALIVSGDFLSLKKYNLEEVINFAKNYGYEWIFIDEIHYLKDWEVILKITVDQQKIGIIATGSSMLEIEKVGDLKRRAYVFNINSLSFSEYLRIRGVNFEKEDELFNLIFSSDLRKNYKKLLKFWMEFEDKKMKKYYNEFIMNPLPALFSIAQNKKAERLKEIISAVVEEDIPKSIPNIETRTLLHAYDILYYIANGEKSSIYKLSNYTGLSKDSISNLLRLLTKSSILYEIPPKGKNILKGVKKYLFHSPLFRRVLAYTSTKLGFEREDLFVKVLKSRNVPVYYEYKQKEGYDFLVLGKKFEIGGKSKRTKKGIINIGENMGLKSGEEFGIPLELFSLIEK